jgi:hypothetical protein
VVQTGEGAVYLEVVRVRQWAGITNTLEEGRTAAADRHSWEGTYGTEQSVIGATHHM